MKVYIAVTKQLKDIYDNSKGEDTAISIFSTRVLAEDHIKKDSYFSRKFIIECDVDDKFDHLVE